MVKQLGLLPFVQATYHIPKDLHRRIKKQAAEEDRTASDLIREAVERYLASREPFDKHRGNIQE